MPEPYYKDDLVTLHHGDCLDVLRELPDASVDAVVTDPPYGLEFMGKAWDDFSGDNRQPFRGEIQTPDNPYGRSTVRFSGSASYGGKHLTAMRQFGDWCELWTAECLRVLKPGGHLLAFGGTRTWHRLACAVEDAGFEVRDSIAWMYGSGFPKSLDVSKAIDKADGRQGAITPNTGRLRGGQSMGAGPATWMSEGVYVKTQHAPATPDAERWQGWGTALKPAFEPIVVARKPLTGTVAANVLAHGTGALNIDGCRVGSEEALVRPAVRRDDNAVLGKGLGVGTQIEPAGRWPANVVLDESQAEALNEQSGEQRDGVSGGLRGFQSEYVGGEGQDRGLDKTGYGSGGGASRFFYVAKADASERVRVDGIAHPTVKPLSLMRWLVRLVTPPGGTVLEPFAGSGTTVEACLLEGFHCIAIEREADYLPLIRQRLARRLDPVEAVRGAGEDGGLFDLLEEETA